MYQFFDDVVENTESGKKSSVRALQAWQYLIAKATNRQIIPYDELRELMGYADSRPMGVILGCIMNYCKQNELPILTIIVVNKKTGIPGEGFTAEDLKDYHQKREDVFNYPWYKLVPPSVDEFKEARERA